MVESDKTGSCGAIIRSDFFGRKFPQVICVNKDLEEICRLVFTGILDFEKRDDSNSPVSNFRQKLNLPI